MAHRRGLAFVGATFATAALGALGMPVDRFGAWIRQEPDVQAHDSATSSWRSLGPAPRERELELTVALRLDDGPRAALERAFWEVSDPDHTSYGQHLDLDEVTELLAVPAERAELVAEYFQGQGATDVDLAPNKDMLTVRMSVEAAEAALSTEIHVFEHAEREGVRILRASRHYSLPEEIAEKVAMVGELLQFPSLPPRSPSSLGGRGGNWPNACDSPKCQGLVTPDVIAKAYKLPEASEEELAKGNSMAVAEFQYQYYKESDLDLFSQSCHRQVSVDDTIGGDLPESGIEAELDIEYIKAVAPEIPLTVIYSSEYSLLRWAKKISSLKRPPLVHSVSYGNDEAQQSSLEYMETCNVAFMKAGVRGLSILFASGDQGVCGREGCGLLTPKFHPDFPAGSPYITAVGGTDFEGDDIGPEATWRFGGGGFSDNFEAPPYQKAAVEAYLNNPEANLPPAHLFNATGRAYPDVAALGGQKTPYCVAVQNRFAGVSGTSASAPVVAGVFAKLNGLRLSKGQRPLGFLNPFIYKNPSAFQDVRSGTNSANGRFGFTAVEGWDPATGHGTPNFQKLATIAIGAEAEFATLVV